MSFLLYSCDTISIMHKHTKIEKPVNVQCGVGTLRDNAALSFKFHDFGARGVSSVESADMVGVLVVSGYINYTDAATYFQNGEPTTCQYLAEIRASLAK